MGISVESESGDGEAEVSDPAELTLQMVESADGQMRTFVRFVGL